LASKLQLFLLERLKQQAQAVYKQLSEQALPFNSGLAGKIAPDTYDCPFSKRMLDLQPVAVVRN